MVSATLALVGFMLSAYLTLWRFGFMGLLQCGTGGCEVVQTSQWASLFGVPVALIGLLGYATLLGVSLWGLSGSWAERPEPTTWLLVLSGGGVAFTAYLTYLEAFVIEAWCRWCLGSAAIIMAILVTALVGWRSIARGMTTRNPRTAP